jgi:ribosomal protein S27E
MGNNRTSDIGIMEYGGNKWLIFRLAKQTLVPQPRSFFMDVKCPGCFTITTVFSHAQTVVICAGCSTVLCQPTGGKARLTEGCSFRRK